MVAIRALSSALIGTDKIRRFMGFMYDVYREKSSFCKGLRHGA